MPSPAQQVASPTAKADTGAAEKHTHDTWRRSSSSSSLPAQPGGFPTSPTSRCHWASALPLPTHRVSCALAVRPANRCPHADGAKEGKTLPATLSWWVPNFPLPSIWGIAAANPLRPQQHSYSSPFQIISHSNFSRILESQLILKFDQNYREKYKKKLHQLYTL